MSPAEAERQRRGLSSSLPGKAPEQTPQPREIPAPSRHLRLVDGDAQRRARRRHVAVSVAMAAVALVCLALVALHVLIAENQFRLDRLEQQAVVQQEAYEKLRLQVAQLEAPARIFSVAEGKLGMQQPGSVTYLPALPAPLSKGQPARAASPQGDADWPMIKPFLSGSP